MPSQWHPWVCALHYHFLAGPTVARGFTDAFQVRVSPQHAVACRGRAVPWPAHRALRWQRSQDSEAGLGSVAVGQRPHSREAVTKPVESSGGLGFNSIFCKPHSDRPPGSILRSPGLEAGTEGQLVKERARGQRPQGSVLHPGEQEGCLSDAG